MIGTASEQNRNYLVGLGAIEVADYATPRLSDVVGTVDAVLDTRGGDDFFRLLDVLRPGGVIVTLKGHTDAQDAALEQHGARGTYTYVAPSGEILERIAPLIADGTVAINVHRAFALDEVAAAHALGEAGHVRGMLVLDVPE